MITAPGAELFALPFPAIQYANKIPSPGPGFASNKKKIDLPAEFPLEIKYRG